MKKITKAQLRKDLDSARRKYKSGELSVSDYISVCAQIEREIAKLTK